VRAVDAPVVRSRLPRSPNRSGKRRRDTKYHTLCVQALGGRGRARLHLRRRHQRVRNIVSSESFGRSSVLVRNERGLWRGRRVLPKATPESALSAQLRYTARSVMSASRRFEPSGRRAEAAVSSPAQRGLNRSLIACDGHRRSCCCARQRHPHRLLRRRGEPRSLRALRQGADEVSDAVRSGQPGCRGLACTRSLNLGMSGTRTLVIGGSTYCQVRLTA
jgi:hypothetical protein